MTYKLTVAGAAGDRDLLVTPDATATVADVSTRLAKLPALAVTLRITLPGATHGLVLDPAAPVRDSSLRSGCRVEVVSVGERRAGDERDDAPIALVRVLSGPGAGHEFRITTGVNLVGREPSAAVYLDGDPEVSWRHATLTATESITVTDLDSASGVHVDGLLVRRATLTAASRVRVGGTELRVIPLAGRQSRTAPLDACHFVRPPLVEPVHTGREIALPQLPAAEEPHRVPLIALAAPLLMGGTLFALTRQPFSLLFAVLSPLMLLGSWLDSRLRGRRRHSARRRVFEAGMRAVRAELTEERERETAGRRAESPGIVAVAEAMRLHSPLLWSRHPSQESFLRLRLGVGDMPSRTTVALPARENGETSDWEAARALAEEFRNVTDVPVCAETERAGAIGVAGAGPLSGGAVNALVLQAAGLHSPAELVVAVFASRHSRSGWEWVKWLPHVDVPRNVLGGVPALVSDETGAEQLLSALERLVESRTRSSGANVATHVPTVLVVVAPDASAQRARLVALAKVGACAGVLVLWTAHDVTELPAVCSVVVDVDLPDAGSVVGLVREARSIRLSAVEAIDPLAAEAAARAIAPLTDAGAWVSDESDLPPRVGLSELHDVSLATDPNAILQRWNRNDSLVAAWIPGTVRDPGGLRAMVGQGLRGPFSLDLRVDGPHALVGGTTGSGKSEFLQSWIVGLATEYAPDRVTFLLVDYKGGSAFADCAGLPHTVGLVTDLSPPLVRRAVVSLRAEIVRRERILSRAGAKDLATMEAAGDREAPPALVIVIDEFAALVAEVPEFINGVIDIAQRGRSLGLHLVLATQRPSGVITANMRANTNLRIALRVADDIDSIDVLGVPDAARFDPSTPGRALVVRGAGLPQVFQTGYLGGDSGSSGSRSGIIVQTLPFGPGDPWVVAKESESSQRRDVSQNQMIRSRRTRPVRDLERFAATIAAAADQARIAIPRRPWLDELPTSIDVSALPESPSGAIGIGLRDEPHRQRQRPLLIDFESVGNVAIVGGGGTGTSTALRTIAAALTAAAVVAASSSCAEVRIYALDCGGGGLALLECLPTVGSVVAGSDLERVDRLLRELSELIAQRAALSCGPLPRVVLLLDGFGVFRAEQEFRDGGRPFDRLLTIAATGRQVGVHVVLSVDRVGVVPAALWARIGARIRLGEAEEVSGSVAGAVATAHGSTGKTCLPGRGRYDGDEVQLAVAGGSSNPAVQAGALEELARRAGVVGVTVTPPVRRLGTWISSGDLPTTTGGRPVLGVADETLEPIGMPTGGVFVISGPFGSGRTTAMTTAVRAVLAACPQTEPYLLSIRDGGLLHAVDWAGHAIAPEAISELVTRLAARIETAGAADADRLLIVVEGVGDFEGHAAESSTARLVKVARRLGTTVIAEADPVTAPTAWQLFAELKSARAGLALQPEESDGVALFRVPFPRLARSAFPPGRGFLVEAGRCTLVHVAVSDTSGAQLSELMKLNSSNISD